MKKLLKGEELRKKCEELGVDMEGDSITSSRSGRHKADDATLQSRLFAAEDHNRQNRLWILAVISAIVAVISAIVAVISAVSPITVSHLLNHL